ncbi:hypothetical protein B0H19DRAFT_1080793 [Mycena capillaripes]|nr:hypothetical protein B0H19DRAFT_1080793 [Mycena capillaripes]
MPPDLKTGTNGHGKAPSLVPAKTVPWYEADVERWMDVFKFAVHPPSTKMRETSKSYSKASKDHIEACVYDTDLEEKTKKKKKNYMHRRRVEPRSVDGQQIPINMNDACTVHDQCISSQHERLPRSVGYQIPFHGIFTVILSLRLRTVWWRGSVIGRTVTPFTAVLRESMGLPRLKKDARKLLLAIMPLRSGIAPSSWQRYGRIKLPLPFLEGSLRVCQITTVARVPAAEPAIISSMAAQQRYELHIRTYVHEKQAPGWCMTA